MHHAVARSARIDPLAAEAFPSPSGREWTAIADYWLKQGGTSPVWFLVEPRRTDLARFDPSSQRVRMALPLARGRGDVRGRRAADDGRLGRACGSPGWFVTDGWALTPEMAGRPSASGAGRRSGGLTAWVRRRPGETRRCWSAGATSARPASRTCGSRCRSTAARRSGGRRRPSRGSSSTPGGCRPARWKATGAFAQLTIAAEAADGSARPVRAAIEQFDVAVTRRGDVSGFGPGWHEMEYRAVDGRDAGGGRANGRRSSVRRAAGRQPVELTLRGESPLRYFDRAPTVRVLAGRRAAPRVHADGDFTERIAVPADALSTRRAARLVIETDQHVRARRTHRATAIASPRTCASYDARVSGFALTGASA